MNIQKMHIAVQQGVDKINSLQADSLLSQEIDLELNKSIMRFVNLKYGKNNIYRQGFEQSQKRIDDLRSLVSSSQEYVYFKERRILSNNYGGKFDLLYIDKYVLPSDYLYHINSYCNVIQDPGCGRTVKFTLERQTERKMVFSFELRQLKIVETRPGDASQIYLQGWIPYIDIQGGITSSAEDGIIDFTNPSTIDQVGGKQIFNRRLWDAVEYGYSDPLWPTLPLPEGSMYSTQLPQFVYINNTSHPATVTFEDTYMNFDVRINKNYDMFIPDDGYSREQDIINSILQAGNVNPGVEIFYEEYDGETYPERFTVEFDLDVWNFLVTPEQAGQFAEFLVSSSKSVDLDTGEILNNTTGSQNAEDFTTYLNISEQILWEAKVLKFLYNEAGQWINGMDISDVYATEDGFTGTIATVEDFWPQFFEIDTVMATMADLGISEFKSGPNTRLNAPSIDYYETNTSGLKRYVSSGNWTLGEGLYESVAGIGVEFPGISKPIKYIQHDDILGLLYDPFNKPTDNRILGVFDSNTILIYSLVKNVTEEDANLVSALPYSIKLKYLKKPVEVNHNLGVSCDLPQHTHEEIVAMTVSSILEGISDPRYKTHMSELMRNE